MVVFSPPLRDNMRFLPNQALEILILSGLQMAMVRKGDEFSSKSTARLFY
jgi:hypothetical protein